MKLEIKDKKENKLLGRLEVEGKLVFEGATPSNEAVKDKLAAELNADKDLIVIKHIHSKFSHQEAELLAFVYDNEEKMDKTEMMTKHLRKGEEEKKAAEEKPAEEKKEEKPAEEKVEEKKEEPKEKEKEEGKEEK